MQLPMIFHFRKESVRHYEQPIGIPTFWANSGGLTLLNSETISIDLSNEHNNPLREHYLVNAELRAV